MHSEIHSEARKEALWRAGAYFCEAHELLFPILRTPSRTPLPFTSAPWTRGAGGVLIRKQQE
jgi:hypothetical protein